jgi:topoisomerase IV subunit A
VGMSTKILPHNPVEVLEAEIACLQGKNFQLYPDFPTAGSVDISEYEDGAGRVRVRATLDSSDPKRLVVRDLPYGVTTESLIASVEKAAKAGRIKIASISDYTTDKVEIEIKLARGEYARDTVDALYAFTQCEQSISCNLLVIKDSVPTLMSVSEVVRYHAQRLLAILKRELELEIRELLDDLHARTLERIFIEERVYKAIETKRTQEAVLKAVIDGLLPFAAEIKRDVTHEDVERLLKIPIRRISLYDIEKARAEMERIKAKLKEARYNLAHLTEYGIGFLKGIADKLRPAWARKTRLLSFDRVDVKEAARRDIAIRYDAQTGYLGSSVSTGEFLFDASPFDRLLVIRRSAMYSVVEVPERLFVDKDMRYCAIADKDALAEVVFSAVYRQPNGQGYIKRCRIEQWIMNKDYALIPDDAQLLFFTAEPKKLITASYASKPRTKINTENFKVESFDIKGLKAQGIRLSPRAIVSVEAPGAPGLFDPPPLKPKASPDGGAAPKAAAKSAAKAASKPKPRPSLKQRLKNVSSSKQAAKPASKEKALLPAKPTKKAQTPASKAKAPAEANAPTTKGRAKPVAKAAPDPVGKPKGGLLEKAEAKKKPK